MKEYRVQNTEYRLICILFILAVILTGCRPRGVLSSHQMREVLVDLHKTEALMQVHNMTRGHYEDRDYYYAQVLEQHHITQAQFDSSLVWYTAHPQLFDKIYPKVIAQLESEKETFIAQHEKDLQLTPIGKRLKSTKPTLTDEQIDSIHWVIMHGMPTLWNPMPKEILMQDSINQLLP